MNMESKGPQLDAADGLDGGRPPRAPRPTWVWLRVGVAVLVLAGIWLSLRVVGLAFREAVSAVKPGAAARSGP